MPNRINTARSRSEIRSRAAHPASSASGRAPDKNGTRRVPIPRPHRPHPSSRSNDFDAHEQRAETRAAPDARGLLRDERGAVTAEYAVVILAGVAFAGLLIAVIRSEEVRTMLVDLVQQALGSAG